MYKKMNCPMTSVELNCIKRTADNTYIPFNPELPEYQAYLKWLEEGNTPEPADEG